MLITNLNMARMRYDELPEATKKRHKGRAAGNIEFMSPSLSLSLQNQNNISKFNKVNTEASRENSQNLSFGVSSLFFKKVNIKPVKVQELLDFYKGHSLGNMPKDLYDNLSKSKNASKYLQVDKSGNITFYKKSIFRLILDGVAYPFVQLPQDMLNGAVTLLGKFKPLKNWAEKTLSSDFFKGIRRRSKEDAKFNAFRGLAEMRDKLVKEGKSQEEIDKAIFKQSAKMFDPKTGNYDTKHERALNRLVSGLPPAIFLANDAYNLSRMMDDDDKKAKKERNQRFRQETARILSSGYLTLITLGALQKYVNNSKTAIMLTTGLTVLVTEMFSRLSNGKYITRLTPEQAKAINAKEAEAKGQKVETQSVVEPKKEVNFKASEKNAENDKEKIQKPLLSFDILLKASLGVIAAGLALKEFRRIPKFDKLLKDTGAYFNNIYKKLTVNPDYTIKKSDFENIVKALEDNGFKDLAVNYRKAAEEGLKKDKDGKIIDDGLIHLGSKNRKIAPLVKFIRAPFKFALDAVTLPYRYFNKLIKALTPKNAEKAKEIKRIDALAISVDKIQAQANKLIKRTLKQNNIKELPKDLNLKDAKFEAFVKDNILKSFNADSMSNVSNAELSNLAKTAALAATIWFLMTDNYNMVMLKSNGEDKDGAETKFKERFVQELSRLFYQTLLIDLFNSTFSGQYHASLFGMSWITLTDTTIGEWLTRQSVGTPTKPLTRDEMLAYEKVRNEATGFKKKYYNFMTRLTGKRSISSYNVNKEKQDEKVVKTAEKTDDKPKITTEQGYKLLKVGK